jgi:hypothetical protein
MQLRLPRRHHPDTCWLPAPVHGGQLLHRRDRDPGGYRKCDMDVRPGDTEHISPMDKHGRLCPSNPHRVCRRLQSYVPGFRFSRHCFIWRRGSDRHGQRGIGPKRLWFTISRSRECPASTSSKVINRSYPRGRRLCASHPSRIARDWNLDWNCISHSFRRTLNRVINTQLDTRNHVRFL